MKENKSQTKTVYNIVAVFDILGFKGLVERYGEARMPTDVLANEVAGLLGSVQAHDYGWDTAYHFLAEGGTATPLSCVAFADTLLVFSEGDSPEDLRTVVAAAAGLIHYFLSAASFPYPLRGAIATGEFVSAIHGSRTAGGEDVAVFLGNAVTRAHTLERAQDWCGAVLDPAVSGDARFAEVVQEMKDARLLVEYAIPCKDGKACEALAVGWPKPFQSRSNVERTMNWLQAHGVAPPIPDKNKEAHTREFFEWYFPA